MENKWQKKLISKHEITMLQIFKNTNDLACLYHRTTKKHTIKVYEKKATYFNYQR